MRATLLAGALLVAAAAGTHERAPDEGARSRRSAVVIRAGAPFALGDRRGDVAFRGACWKVAGGWVSDEERGVVRVAIAIARTCG